MEGLCFQAIGSYRSHGNFIAASAAYMAFNWDTNGSNLAVLPLDTKGRQHKVSLQKCIYTLLEHTVWICCSKQCQFDTFFQANVPLLHAHSDFVTDFAFSPFDDGLLATGSQDLSVSRLERASD